MADTTSETQDMNRDEFATYLRQLSEEFAGDGAVDVEIGNKTVTVTPTAQITCRTTVEEASSGVMSNASETVEIAVAWDPES